MTDIVKKPSHYQVADGIEAIDIINAVVDRFATTPYEGYLLGNFLKYRLRIGDKDDIQQDLDKSNEYRNRLRLLRAPKVWVGEASCEGDCANCTQCKPPLPVPCADECVNLDDFMRDLRKSDPYPEY